MNPERRIWKEQCEAACGIKQRFGLDQAVSYLVGEKFMNFLRAADRDSDFAAELPQFVAEVRRIFEPGAIGAYLDSVGRARAIGHGARDDDFAGFEAEGIGPEDVVRGAEEFLLALRAKELLLPA